MNPTHRSMRKVVLGAAVLAPVGLAGVFIWATPRQIPANAVPGNERGTDTAEPMGSDSAPGGMRGDSTDPIETERQPVISGRGTTGTSLLVRVVDRATGEPVPGFTAALIPKDAVAFAYEEVQGVSDPQGEILWDGISWPEVQVYPPYEFDAAQSEEQRKLRGFG